MKSIILSIIHLVTYIIIICFIHRYVLNEVTLRVIRIAYVEHNRTVFFEGHGITRDYNYSEVTDKYQVGDRVPTLYDSNGDTFEFDFPSHVPIGYGTLMGFIIAASVIIFTACVKPLKDEDSDERMMCLLLFIAVTLDVHFLIAGLRSPYTNSTKIIHLVISALLSISVIFVVIFIVKSLIPARIKMKSDEEIGLIPVPKIIN